MKRKTNVEIIKQVMTVSQFGAMAQMVVIHAIRSYVDTVAATTEKPRDWNDFVSWESWRGSCVEIKNKLDDFYR